MATPESASGGRREERRARTHDALVAAARRIALERGVAEMTAEDIAEAAGVSRRTFFNYFPTLEAVVAEGLRPVLDEIAGEVLRRPAGEDPLEAIAAALRERPIPAEILLGWARPGAARPHLRSSVQLRLWQHHEEWLVHVLAQRMTEHDDLAVRSLAATVMAIFELVQDRWSATDGDLGETVAGFNADLVRALGHARAGWRGPTALHHP